MFTLTKFSYGVRLLMFASCVLQEWWSVAYSYDPATHHPSLTSPVFLRLRGSQLQIGQLSSEVDYHTVCHPVFFLFFTFFMVGWENKMEKKQFS